MNGAWTDRRDGKNSDLERIGVTGYSSLSNKRAAHLINFLKNSYLHALITTCTFINFEKFSSLHVYSFLHVY